MEHRLTGVQRIGKVDARAQRAAARDDAVLVVTQAEIGGEIFERLNWS